MKFRFLITDTMSGEMFGTNDLATALNYAKSEDYFVGDALDGYWLAPHGSLPIEEIND